MINQWINPKVVQDVESTEMRSKFMHAKPFAHVEIKEFFIPEKMHEISEEVKKLDFEYKEADLFSFSQSLDFVNFTSGILKEFYEFLCSREFAEFMGKLTGIGLMPDAVDLAATEYGHTDYLLCHDDKIQDRKVAYILYLEDLKEDEGGEFALLDCDKKGQPSKVVRKYPPKYGNLMVFGVNSRSYHEVQEVLTKKKKRYAIGGWLR